MRVDGTRMKNCDADMTNHLAMIIMTSQHIFSMVGWMLILGDSPDHEARTVEARKSRRNLQKFSENQQEGKNSNFLQKRFLFSFTCPSLE